MFTPTWAEQNNQQIPVSPPGSQNLFEQHRNDAPPAEYALCVPLELSAILNFYSAALQIHECELKKISKLIMEEEIDASKY